MAQLTLRDHRVKKPQNATLNVWGSCETYPRYSIILIKMSLESIYSYSFVRSVFFGWLNVRRKL